MAGKYEDPGAHGSEISVIETYGKYGPATAKIVHPCSGKNVKEHMQKHLSLKEESLQLFGVFLGGLEYQLQVFEDDMQIPVGKRMSFARFNGNLKLEAKLIQKDDAALHLLFSEAKHAVETGVVQPTDEQAVQLEDYLDPMFPVERQYLELVHKCQGYGTFVFSNCVVNRHTTRVIVKVTPTSLIIDNEIGMVSFRLIKSWNLDTKWNTISFDVNPTGHNSTALLVETNQVLLLNQAITMYCHDLAVEMNIIAPNLPQRPMGKYVDPIVLMVNQLYKPKLSFDKI